MRLFDAAYLKLTAWYVTIIMVISLLFSVWVYNQARSELAFGLNRFVKIGPFIDPQSGELRTIIQDRLEDSKRRVLGRLVLFNTIVLVAGAAGSYMLARRTLQPVEEAVEAQNRFTADAAHELRTPLAVMKSEIEVGLRAKKLTKEEAVALLKSNLEEVDRLGALTEGLLTLSRTDSDMQLSPVPLEEIAAKVAKRFKPLADTKRVTINRQLEPVIVAAEEQAVDEIIGILMDNALKYSPALTAVTLRTCQKDGHGYLEVKDQGIGIKASELPHVFDRFYRADSARTQARAGGHGLGLSIAQKLAEGLGAQLHVKSRPGKGSLFTLKLGLAKVD